MKTILFLFILTIMILANSATIFSNNNLDYPGIPGENIGFPRIPVYADAFRRRCPICDSSVYSYCNDKLFHDSCCCHNSNNPYDRVPYQCRFADCSFLHANSCPEHKLITACCCTSFNLFKK